MKGSTIMLTCEMKAPSDSVIYWSLKLDLNRECKIPTLNSNVSLHPALLGLKICNTSAVSKLVREYIDDEFSLFHLELEVRKCINLISNNYLYTIDKMVLLNHPCLQGKTKLFFHRLKREGRNTMESISVLLSIPLAQQKHSSSSRLPQSSLTLQTQASYTSGQFIPTLLVLIV